MKIGKRKYNTKGKGNLWKKTITDNEITNNKIVHRIEINGHNKDHERCLGNCI